MVIPSTNDHCCVDCTAVHRSSNITMVISGVDNHSNIPKTVFTANVTVYNRIGVTLMFLLLYAVPGLRQHGVKTSIFKSSVHPLVPYSLDQTPRLLLYFITQFCAASIQARLLIESSVY